MNSDSVRKRKCHAAIQKYLIQKRGTYTKGKSLDNSGSNRC